MNKLFINLNIEQFEENWEKYFVATSNDLQWLVVEWNSIENTIKLAEEVAYELIELKKSKENKQLFKFPIWINLI